MPEARYFSPVDTVSQKLQIERRLGGVKACKYFNLLTRFLSLKISRPEFDKLSMATIGRDNDHLHNHFLRSILKKASLSNILPSRICEEDSSLSVKTLNGYEMSNLQLVCRDFSQSPRKWRNPTLDSGSKTPLSVEDGEEFDQDSGSPSIYRRSPVKAPLGIPTKVKGTQKIFGKGLASSSVTTTCQNIGQLPDTNSLLKKLEQKLQIEGFKISMDSAYLLNNTLDVYLKRLVKLCLDLVVSKSVDTFSGPIQLGLNGLPVTRFVQKPSASVFVSF